MSKKSAVIGYSLFLLLHLFFVGKSLFEIAAFNSVTFIFLAILGLLVFSYSRLMRDEFNVTGNLIEFLTLVVGSLLTFYLNNYLEWGAVIASAAVGLAGGLLPYIKPPS